MRYISWGIKGIRRLAWIQIVMPDAAGHIVKHVNPFLSVRVKAAKLVLTLANEI